jgi:4a-hydroxytetrahydrobiopterin dehydratase
MPTTRPTKLSDSEIATALAELPPSTWTVAQGKLHREYRFSDFIAAFGFMTGAALVAQAMDHHPEWFNVWNTVRVDLSTHDAGGITALDFELARAMEDLARRQPAKSK